jgi:anti-anti-sigma factor
LCQCRNLPRIEAEFTVAIQPTFCAQRSKTLFNSVLRLGRTFVTNWPGNCSFTQFEIQTECFDLSSCSRRIEFIKSAADRLPTNPNRIFVSLSDSLRPPPKTIHLEGSAVTMPIHHEVLRVYETGPLTVVGFGSDELPDHIDLVECREEIIELLTLHDCKDLAFDLTGVRYIPSGMLGLLASLKKLGIQVHLYNPSGDVREVLQVTHLDQLFKIHDLDL